MSDEESVHDEEMKEEEEEDNEGSSEGEDEEGGSSSSSDVEPEEIIRSRVESLVQGRQRRSNAGAKMATLISDLAALTRPEEGDVYTTAYGGFMEEEGDDDFKSDQEEADDELDSDFDIDETQEPEAEGQEDDDEGKTRRPKRTAKMAYEVSAARRAKKEEAAAKPKPKAPPKPKSPPKEPTEAAKVAQEFLSQRSLRARKPARRLEVEEDDAKPSPKKRVRHRKKKEEEKKQWTQEELLEEAKETEKKNLASLMKYQLLELEKSEAKKKARRTAREVASSFIRYHSFSVPDVEEAGKSTNNGESIVGRHEVSLISFSDDPALKEAFPTPSTPVKKKNAMDIKKGTAVCPISNMKARYFDPVTMMPYASATTFRALRDAYCNQLESFYKNKEAVDPTALSSPLKKNDELAAWLQWKRQEREKGRVSSASSPGVPSNQVSQGT